MIFPEPMVISEIHDIILAELDKLMYSVESKDEYLTSVVLLRNSNDKIKGVSSLDELLPNMLVYVSDRRKYLQKANKSVEQIGGIIVSPELENNFSNLPTIITPFPKLCVAALLNRYRNVAHRKGTLGIKFAAKKTVIIDKSAQIGDLCFIGKNVSIGRNTVVSPFVYIDDNVTIGNDVFIYPNATILNNVQIGNNVIIHPGVIIGGDGFGYEQILEKNNVLKHIKIPHIGRVRIGNGVEIGANTCIDRGFIDDTIIEDGTKIDNLVQIAHNVKIGNNCILVSQVGVAGNSRLGDEVVLFGQVGIADNFSVGSRNIITAQSGVMTNIPDSSPEKRIAWAGSPAIHAYKNWKQVVLAEKNIPALISALSSSETFEDFKNIYTEKIKKMKIEQES